VSPRTDRSIRLCSSRIDDDILQQKVSSMGKMLLELGLLFTSSHSDGQVIKRQNFAPTFTSFTACNFARLTSDIMGGNRWKRAVISLLACFMYSAERRRAANECVGLADSID